MYNKTLLERLSEAKDDVVDICILRWIEIVSTIVFLYAFAGGRRRWMNVLHFVSLCEVVYGIICPKSFISALFEGTPDETHLQLGQLCCFVGACWVLCYWLLSKSTDSTAETSLLLAYTVMGCCVALANFYAMTHQMKKSTLKISDEMKVSLCYMQLLVVCGNLYFYLSAKDWGGYGEINSNANFHLRADFVLLMIMGLLMYALPQWIIRLMSDVDKIDTMHALLSRHCGSVLLAMALMSGRSANFLRTSDKDAVAFSHLLFYIMLVLTSLWAAVQGWAELQWTETGMKTLHNLVLVVNAAGALNFDSNIFQKILLPRLRAIPGDLQSCWKWKTM